MLETDPMSALNEVREAILRTETISVETKQDAIGFIVECIRKVRKNSRYLAELQRSTIFLNDELGARKLSVMVARYVLDFEDVSGPRYEKARSYGQLADYFAETDLSAQAVADHLHRHGIRASLEHFKKTEREAAVEGELIDELDDSEDDADLLPTSNAAPLGERRSTGRPPTPPSRAEIVKRALAQPPSPKMTRPKLDLDTSLVSEGSDRLLRQILATPEGETVTVTMLREPNKEGQDWKRFVIQDVVD